VPSDLISGKSRNSLGPGISSISTTALDSGLHDQINAKMNTKKNPCLIMNAFADYTTA
jgi:hypothetical protein